MSLEPPEEEEHASLERAESVVCRHARLQGYALTRKNLVKDKRKPPTVRRRDLRCSKGGVKRGEGVLRETGTRMTECPFEIRILRTEWGTWKFRSIMEITIMMPRLMTLSTLNTAGLHGSFRYSLSGSRSFLLIVQG